jgi:hypothetical protein
VPKPTSGDVIPATAAPHGGPFDWRRRQFVVDARYQLRAGVLVGMITLVLLVLLSAALIVPNRRTAGPAETASRPLSAGQDPTSWALVLLGSTVLLGGVIVLSVLESHRTAGAAYAIRRAVDAIRDGRSEIRIRLRQGDHLQELARAINQLAETIDAERSQRS